MTTSPADDSTPSSQSASVSDLVTEQQLPSASASAASTASGDTVDTSQQAAVAAPVSVKEEADVEEEEKSASDVPAISSLSLDEDDDTVILQYPPVKLSDITIRWRHCQLKLHKVILASASDHLLTLMESVDGNTLTLPADIVGSIEELDTFFKLLYATTNPTAPKPTVSLSYGIIRGVTHMSHYFEVKTLEKRCQVHLSSPEYLQDANSKGQLWGLIRFAEQYHLAAVVEACDKYISTPARWKQCNQGVLKMHTFALAHKMPLLLAASEARMGSVDYIEYNKSDWSTICKWLQTQPPLGAVLTKWQEFLGSHEQLLQCSDVRQQLLTAREHAFNKLADHCEYHLVSQAESSLSQLLNLLKFACSHQQLASLQQRCQTTLLKKHDTVQSYGSTYHSDVSATDLFDVLEACLNLSLTEMSQKYIKLVAEPRHFSREWCRCVGEFDETTQDEIWAAVEAEKDRLVHRLSEVNRKLDVPMGHFRAGDRDNARSELGNIERAVTPVKAKTPA